MSSVSKIKLPDNTVLDIKDDRMGNARIFHGTCSTAGATAAKVVSCTDFISAELVKGALIFVTFSYTNSATAADLTMNVNSTGAKSIKKQGNSSSTNNLAAVGEIRANSTYLFHYDGTNWVCISLDYNSTYSALTEADMKAGTATTGRTITAARVKQAVEYWMVQNQIDWDETDPTSPSYIANKPSVGGAGTLDTTATTAQSTSSSESLGGSVTLHKVAKTGTYSDLIGTPTIPEVFTAIYDVTTLADIISAYNAGKIIQLNSSGDIGYLQEAYLDSGNESFMFSCCVGTKINYYIIDTNGWSVEAASIPDAPGTLDTTATTAQSTSASEDLSGSVTLHKVAKTGTYSDLIGTPMIPSASSTTPAMDGSASAGSETAFARGDHVHPSDTSKENSSNKVTALSSSSTDDQYPSAKCVYDLIGDIETLLAAL